MSQETVSTHCGGAGCGSCPPDDGTCICDCSGCRAAGNHRVLFGLEDEWTPNLRALRVFYVALRAGEKRVDEANERVWAIAAELAEFEPPEAWADPQDLESDGLSPGGIYYAHYTLSAILPNGDLHRSGTKRPPLPDGARWTLTQGIRSERQGTPQNEELGARAYAAWTERHELQAVLRDARKVYEAALRELVEAP